MRPSRVRFPLSIHRAKGKKLIEQVYPCVFQSFFARVRYGSSCRPLATYVGFLQIFRNNAF